MKEGRREGEREEGTCTRMSLCVKQSLLILLIEYTRIPWLASRLNGCSAERRGREATRVSKSNPYCLYLHHSGHQCQMGACLKDGVGEREGGREREREREGGREREREREREGGR